MDKTEHNHHSASENTQEEYLKFILVIIVILTISNLLYVLTDSIGLSEWVRWFMGVFLITFAGFKFAGYKMFVEMFQGYDLLAKHSKLYAQAYPIIELVLGLLFIFDQIPTIRHISVIVLMGVGAIGVYQEIRHRRSGVHCACLGNIIKLPLSTVSMVENVSMVVMATWMLLA